MANRGYLIDKPPPPSPLSVFFDQKIIPAAIDGAACMEMTISQVAIAARKRPFAGLSVALGIGYVLAAMFIPVRKPSRPIRR